MKVRIALFSSLICVGSLAFHSPARAQSGPPGGGSSGQWVITYDYAVTGTRTAPNPVPPGVGQVALPIDRKDTGDTGGTVGLRYGAGYDFQTAQINYTNTITAHLKWMQVDSYDPNGGPVWKPAPMRPRRST